MTAISTRLRGINPVLDRELRQRSRSARSMVIMTVFLLLALGLLYLIYLAETSNNNPGGGVTSDVLNRQIGRTMFEWVLMLEMLIILFVVPGLSAGAISGERDRQTLVPLQVTLVGAKGIFFGKVGAATAFVTLVVTASIPVLAIAYLVGGLSILSMVMSVVTMIATGFLMAVIGVGASAMVRRTTAAVLLSYGMMLLVTIGTLVAFAVIAIVGVVIEPSGDLGPLSTLPFYLNPFVTLAGAGGVTDLTFNDVWPLSAIKTGMVSVERDPNGVANVNEADVAWVPLWIRCLLVQGSVAALFAWAGLRKLRTPSPMIRQ